MNHRAVVSYCAQKGGVLRSNLPTKCDNNPLFADESENLPEEHPYMIKNPKETMNFFAKKRGVTTIALIFLNLQKCADGIRANAFPAHTQTLQSGSL